MWTAASYVQLPSGAEAVLLPGPAIDIDEEDSCVLSPSATSENLQLATSRRSVESSEFTMASHTMHSWKQPCSAPACGGQGSPAGHHVDQLQLELSQRLEDLPELIDCPTRPPLQAPREGPHKPWRPTTMAGTASASPYASEGAVHIGTPHSPKASSPAACVLPLTNTQPGDKQTALYPATHHACRPTYPPHTSPPTHLCRARHALPSGTLRKSAPSVTAAAGGARRAAQPSGGASWYIHSTRSVLATAAERVPGLPRAAAALYRAGYSAVWGALVIFTLWVWGTIFGWLFFAGVWLLSQWAAARAARYAAARLRRSCAALLQSGGRAALRAPALCSRLAVAAAITAAAAALRAALASCNRACGAAAAAAARARSAVEAGVCAAVAAARSAAAVAHVAVRVGVGIVVWSTCVWLSVLCWGVMLAHECGKAALPLIGAPRSALQRLPGLWARPQVHKG